MNLHVDTLLETSRKTVTLYRSTAYVYAEQDYSSDYKKFSIVWRYSQADIAYVRESSMQVQLLHGRWRQQARTAGCLQTSQLQ